MPRDELIALAETMRKKAGLAYMDGRRDNHVNYKALEEEYRASLLNLPE